MFLYLSLLSLKSIPKKNFFKALKNSVSGRERWRENDKANVATEKLVNLGPRYTEALCTLLMCFNKKRSMKVCL